MELRDTYSLAFQAAGSILLIDRNVEPRDIHLAGNIMLIVRNGGIKFRFTISFEHI